MSAAVLFRIIHLPVTYQKPNMKIHKTIFSPVALYGCKTLSLTFGDETEMEIFENKMSKRIFDLTERK